MEYLLVAGLLVAGVLSRADSGARGVAVMLLAVDREGDGRGVTLSLCRWRWTTFSWLVAEELREEICGSIAGNRFKTDKETNTDGWTDGQMDRQAERYR